MNEQLEKDIENLKEEIKTFQTFAESYNLSDSEKEYYLDLMLDNLASLMRKRDKH